MDYTSFFASLISGAAAGTVTDVVFFPIDTIKTRLQAKGGFFANGGYQGIYRGIGSALVSSAPNASLFFVTYDSMKTYLKPILKSQISNEQVAEVATNMISSSLGEVSACLIRVPAEIIKQQTQTHSSNSSWNTLKILLNNKNREGLRRNLYRGWWSTIFREIPFTCIQFSLYEQLKKSSSRHSKKKQVSSFQAAMCGSIAGGIAAAITTPLDVLKTRKMLNHITIPAMELARSLYHEGGILAFFKGIGPRTIWISVGGAIFLGLYETVHTSMTILML